MRRILELYDGVMLFLGDWLPKILVACLAVFALLWQLDLLFR